jgi:hypothetical protein
MSPSEEAVNLLPISSSVTAVTAERFRRMTGRTPRRLLISVEVIAPLPLTEYAIWVELVLVDSHHASLVRPSPCA